MKKFYSLALAAAVSAASLSVSAKEFTAKRSFDMTAETATTVQTTKITAAFLKENGTLSQRADRDVSGTYYLSCTAGESSVFEEFTIAKGTEANTYVVKGLFWGEDAKDLNAEYIAGDYEGQHYEFFVIPQGQPWFDNSGKECIIKAGVKSSGGWGTVTGQDKEDIDLEFEVFEDEGDLVMQPAWAVNGYSSGLAWVYADTPNRGNCFPDTEFLLANAEFTSMITLDGQSSNPCNGAAFVSSYKKLGKNMLELTGFYTPYWAANTLNLEVAANGTATASEEVAVTLYADDSMTTTFDAYYWTPANATDKAAPAKVNATVVEADGKTTITFANDVVYLAKNENGTLAAMLGWIQPKFVVNRTFTAGVENIAADAEFDATAPVEYYNLQGVRVANPEAGQLLIKRQGSKASKVVIR